MILAFFIECECPPDRRAATVGGGEFSSVEEFLESYQLTHIECWSCRNYYRLIGYMDETGVERAVSREVEAPPRPRRRRLSLSRTTR
ncbi:hypothetical protein BH23ACT5_BH23ACT5_24110 [soil metagenome]